MKKQHFIVLAALLGLLVVLRFVVDSTGGEVATELEEAGVARLLPDLETAAVTRVRVSAAGDDATLEVRRDPDRGWIVTSAHGATAERERVDDFLQTLADLAGEVRAESASVHAEFGVGEEHATKLELWAGEGEPRVLFLGAAGDQPGAHFVRAAGSDQVRHVSEGVREELGLIGERRVPAPDHWVDKQVLDLDVATLARIEMDRPDQSYVLEHVLAELPDGDAEGDQAPPAPEREWRVTTPSLPWEQSSWGASGVASRLARLRVNSVLDPASPRCAPGPSWAELRVHLDSGDEEVLRVGPAGGQGEDAPLRLEGRDGCFGLSSWAARSLLPKASQLYEVPDPLDDDELEAEDVEELTVTRDGARARLVRGQEGWGLVEPDEAAADGARADRLARAVLSLRVDDLASAGSVADRMSEVHGLVEAKTSAGRISVRVLGVREGTNGDRFVVLQGRDLAPEGFVAVMAEADVQSLLPALEELRGEGST